MLKDCLGKFLNAMQDSNLNVRRVALVTFNSAAHNKPSLVRELLVNPKQENANESFINYLYRETKVKKILIYLFFIKIIKCFRCAKI